jgi:hypothetical protein
MKNLATILLAAAISAPALTTGCAARVRVYDPYYHDYHNWNGEVIYYNQREAETHRQHVDFKKRSAEEQKAYWDWRHSYGDHH